MVIGTTDYARWTRALRQKVTVGDSSAVTATGGSLNVSSVGVGTTRASALKQLVRLKVEVVASVSAESAAHFRLLNLMWEPS